jgi:hypothetical protein
MVAISLLKRPIGFFLDAGLADARTSGGPRQFHDEAATERRRDGQAAPEPALGQGVFRFMKTFIVKCPVTDVNIITPMPEAVVVPPEGTTVYLECPCCGLPHQMRLRDARYFKRAS